MGQWAPLEVLLPATDFDHAVIGRYRWRLDPEGNPQVELAELDRYGTPCAAPAGPAVDACLAELAGPIPIGECAAGVPGCNGFYLTATRGAVVEHFLDHEGLMRFLGGRVDSPEAALLVVHARGANLGRARDNCSDEIVRPAAEGYYVLTYVDQGCFSGLVETLHVAPDGSVQRVASHEDDSVGAPCEVGRLTAGLSASEAHTSHPMAPGAHLDTMAALEGTAVAAFERLARELLHHGAPDALVQGARRAAAQEVHHTRMVAGLARAHGGRGDARPIRDRLPVRDLESIALENAREGCVRETYGAAVAHYQASRAADPGVRTAMECIAHDESEHAELSWRVAAWLDTQLDAPARSRVLAGRHAVAASLWRHAADPADASTAAIVGMPSAAAGRHMLGALMRTLWT